MVRLIFHGLLVMVALVLLAWFVQDLVDPHWVDTHIRSTGTRGMLLYALVCCLLGTVGLSRQIIAFLGGYAFGFCTGLLLSLLAVVAACILTWFFAHALLRSLLADRLPQRVQRLDRFLHDNTFTMALLLRLLPLGSNWMINIAAGVSSVRVVPFVGGSLLGYIPQMIIFSLLGSGTRVSQFWQVAVAMALFVMAAALGFVLYKRLVRARELTSLSAAEPAAELSAVTLK